MINILDILKQNEKFRNCYYAVKDYFRPHNVLKIRNMPKSFVDKDEKVFHCVFSVLCDFVEKEHHGPEKYKEYIDMLGVFTEEQKNEKNNEIWIEHSKRQAIEHQKVLDLYNWYISIDWKDPIPFDWATSSNEECQNQCKKEIEFYAECTNKTKQAIESRSLWWT